MFLSPLRIAAATYVLGVMTSEDLVRVADETLEQGTYTQGLGELAASSQPEMADVGPLFERSLRELGMYLPSMRDAVWIVLCHHIRSIAEEKTVPRNGLRLIIKNVYYPARLHEKAVKFVGDSHGLEYLIAFFYSYDDLEERPDEVSFEGKYGKEAIAAMDREVIRHAKLWIEKLPTISLDE